MDLVNYNFLIPNPSHIHLAGHCKKGGCLKTDLQIFKEAAISLAEGANTSLQHEKNRWTSSSYL